VVEALKSGYEHDEEARDHQLSAQERLAYHQPYSAPILPTRKSWLEQQTEERRVEPTSSLGKAIAYLLGHGATLTRFVTVPGAPLANKVAERARKLCRRQRKNSLFYATEHSAYIASLLTSVIGHLCASGGDCAGVSGGGPGASPGGASQSRRLAAVELSRRARALVTAGAPERRQLRALGIAVP